MSEELNLLVGVESSWSIRALLCIKMAGLDCNDNVVSLGGDKKRLKALSETQLVPVLHHGPIKVYDSLAIAEYINELKAGTLYPAARNKRAIARSLCAELHSGFQALRASCPFTFGPAGPVERSASLNYELKRLEFIFSAAIGPFYYSEPSIVDAFYAVLAYRLNCYGIVLSGAAGEYQQALLEWDVFKSGINQARAWQC